MPTTPLEFLEGCCRYLEGLPQEQRLIAAIKVLDKLKSGPVGRGMLSELQRIYFLNFMHERLTVANG